MRTYRLHTPAFEAAIDANEADVIVGGASAGKCIESLPIIRWSIGKRYDALLKWCKRKWPRDTQSVVVRNE